jgi:hypothetical protein
VSSESRVGDVENGCVDYTNDGLARNAEGNGYAEHWEEVGIVYSSIEGVDDPRW